MKPGVHCSKTPGFNEALSNAYLKSEGLYSLRDVWIQLHYPEWNTLCEAACRVLWGLLKTSGYPISSEFNHLRLPYPCYLLIQFALVCRQREISCFTVSCWAFFHRINEIPMPAPGYQCSRGVSWKKTKCLFVSNENSRSLSVQWELSPSTIACWDNLFAIVLYSSAS